VPSILKARLQPGGQTDLLVATRNHPNVPLEPYLVTAVTRERKPILRDPSAAVLFLDELRRLRTELGFLVLAYVVMPDHIHLVIVPGQSIGLAKIMQRVKGRFARLWNLANGATGKVWQSRYDETTIHDDASLDRCIEYVEENAVMAGLTEEIDAYPFSSASRQDGDREAFLSGSWLEQPG